MAGAAVDLVAQADTAFPVIGMVKIRRAGEAPIVPGVLIPQVNEAGPTVAVFVLGQIDPQAFLDRLPEGGPGAVLGQVDQVVVADQIIVPGPWGGRVGNNVFVFIVIKMSLSCIHCRSSVGLMKVRELNSVLVKHSTSPKKEPTLKKKRTARNK